jgi:hypothetical protein
MKVLTLQGGEDRSRGPRFFALLQARLASMKQLNNSCSQIGTRRPSRVIYQYTYCMRILPPYEHKKN